MKIGLTPRRRGGVQGSQLVKAHFLDAASAFPRVFAPTTSGVNLCSWLEKEQQRVEKELAEHGAILFRGFQLSGPEAFQQFARIAVKGELLNYTFRSTPRTAVTGKVYTSTEYPARETIPQHNENAYAPKWPMKLLFHCRIAAQEGGETPLADSRAITPELGADLMDTFAAKGVMYVRNYGGLDLPWQEVFQTADQHVVAQQCQQMGLDYTWLDNDRLRTKYTGPALARHPFTGEVFWFNQAHLFHPAALPPAVRQSLRAQMSEDDLPRNVYFGDGSTIPDDVIETIGALYQAHTRTFRWEEGDILLLDNMRVSHGRRPFQGERQVLVAMGEAHAVSRADYQLRSQDRERSTSPEGGVPC